MWNTGTEKQVHAEKHVPVFPLQKIVTALKKNQGVVRSLLFSPYMRKMGTQKTGWSFQRCPCHQRYFFVASQHAGPTHTKILKWHSTTANSQFMINLAAEMLFKKTAGCFCAVHVCSSTLYWVNLIWTQLCFVRTIEELWSGHKIQWTTRRLSTLTSCITPSKSRLHAEFKNLVVKFVMSAANFWRCFHKSTPAADVRRALRRHLRFGQDLKLM